jgi:anti-sigma regulatory factor (Ser/Thr protein kinase)
LAARLLCEEVVLHALEHGGATFVTMEVEPAKDPYLPTFEDDGVSFDPTTRATAGATHTPEETSTRGRGLLLMRAWTRRMEHRREEGRNKLSVRLVA